MSKIKMIKAREILDSRGQPTIEADVILTTGEVGRASVPSGASTGSQEAFVLRDLQPSRYQGQGVQQAVAYVNDEIAQTLQGYPVTQQTAIDEQLIALDGTEKKTRLGANTMLSVSLAVAKAAALYKKQMLYQYLGQHERYYLPVPMMNIINGGLHADNNLNFQEFMILPLGAPTFAEALRAGVEVFYCLKQLLKQQHYATNIGDEGGFSPDLPHQEAAFDLILTAITKAGYVPHRDIGLALDIASNELYQNGRYYLHTQPTGLSSDEWIAYLLSLVEQYAIISIEDALAESDWDGWIKLTQRLNNTVQLVGDDVFVTNTQLIKQGIQKGVGNAVLIKPNQIGTLTETRSAIMMAQQASYHTIVSHRSGETEDTTIADLAVAMNTGQIKTGSLCRTERVAKYNQLLRIEECLGAQGQYAGGNIYPFLQRSVALKG